MRRLDPQRPMDLRQVVHATIGHLAAGMIVKPAEAIKRAILVIAAFRRWAQPGIPIEALRGVLVRSAADALGPFVLDVKAADDGDFADAAVLNKIGHLFA